MLRSGAKAPSIDAINKSLSNGKTDEAIDQMHRFIRSKDKAVLLVTALCCERNIFPNTKLREAIEYKIESIRTYRQSYDVAKHLGLAEAMLALAYGEDQQAVAKISAYAEDKPALKATLMEASRDRQADLPTALMEICQSQIATLGKGRGR